MKRILTSAGVAAALLLLLASMTTAAPLRQSVPPNRFTYQGHVLNEMGQPVPDGNYAMEFSFYNAPSGGTRLWGPEYHLVAVDDGYFAVVLGSDSAITAESLTTNTYLEISVAGETMSPRHQLTAVPFALVAGECISGTGGGGSSGDAWLLAGNSGASGAVLGTLDAVSLTVVVNGTPMLVISPTEELYSIAGGVYAVASGRGATVGGGAANTASGELTTICGGSDNVSSVSGASICGGTLNVASDYMATVSGGFTNEASGPYSAVGGGAGNIASGGVSVVSGGGTNISSESFSTVSGGNDNSAEGQYSVVGGGASNTAMEDYSVVCGGASNTTGGLYTTISGGYDNSAGGPYATVGGGYDNSASVNYSTVGGGSTNSAGGYGATVGGGEHNIISAGSYATIPGGWYNAVSGDYSLAAGRQANANYDGCFVWGDSTNATVNCGGPDRFIVRASGGVTMYTSGNLSTGATLPAGSGSWSSLSDRDAKTGIEPVDTGAILAALGKLDISAWSYSASPDVPHIGPMAQDFYAAFGYGDSDRYISSVDADGVALAALQALLERVVALEARVAELEATCR